MNKNDVIIGIDLGETAQRTKTHNSLVTVGRR
jgi:hypothetical protein